VVDNPNGFAIATTAADETNVDVAGDASGALVTWTARVGGFTNGDVRAVTFDASGTMSGVINVAATTTFEGYSTVALDPTSNQYLVAYQLDYNSPDIVAVRMSRAGALIDTTPINVAGGFGYQFSPFAGFDGTN